MNNKTKYTFLSYLFVLLTLFIVFISTKDLVINVLSTSSQLQQLELAIKEKSKEYDALLQLKNDLYKWQNEFSNFSKFLINFSEDELLDYFYTYAHNHVGTMKIESLHVSEWKINEFWLMQWDIKLQAVFQKEQDMIDLLNFLLRSEKFNLYIHEFTYPYGSITKEPIAVTIPIKILYK